MDSSMKAMRKAFTGEEDDKGLVDQVSAVKDQKKLPYLDVEPTP